jgi:quinoprotein glucose dehydrogenase
MTATDAPACPGRTRNILAIVLGLVGLYLAAGGAWLIALKGSPYYLLAGLATAASGFFVWRGRRLGARIYAVMLVLTVAWALWEAGLDGWALAPRVIAPFVLGLAFLLPSIRGGSGEAAPPRWYWSRRGFALGVAVAALLGILLHVAIGRGPADPIYQAGTTRTIAGGGAAPADVSGDEWRNWGANQGGQRYSPLDLLTPANVAGLKPAWTVHVGGVVGNYVEKLEVTPLKVGDSLYACTGYNDVLSIDAETGHVNWRYRNNPDKKAVAAPVCRGVSYYQVPGATGPCAQRIIEATNDAKLIALDTATGAPCPGFGVGGVTSLLDGLGPVQKAYYSVTSPPAIVRGKIVLGGSVLDGQYWGEPSGVIRAYDAVTGKFAWAFDMGRPDKHDEPGQGDMYTRSTPNSWPGWSADEALGLVYIPTGNATPDYFAGRRRPFDDQYSSSVLALDVETGALRWSFQTTHHDIWDYDVASQPVLVDIKGPNGIEHALIQPTKRGEIFLLDRITGKPLATVEERQAPQAGKVPEERLSPTQPFSVGMPAFSGPAFRERDMWGLTPLDQLICRIKFRSSRYEGPVTPQGLSPAIIYPGYVGGVDWGSVSVDPVRQLMIVNSSRVANYDHLIPRDQADKMGIRPYDDKKATDLGGGTAQAGTPYAVAVGAFFSPLKVPCNEPPYGMLAAVDLTTRKLVWAKRLGTARDSGPWGIPSLLPITMGVPNNGGSLVTKSGLIFIGATQERTFRAFDVNTGKELWQARLPGGGQATPMTYRSAKSGRQFVVIAAGGFPLLGAKQSDAIVAYALPK